MREIYFSTIYAGACVYVYAFDTKREALERGGKCSKLSDYDEYGREFMMESITHDYRR